MRARPARRLLCAGPSERRARRGVARQASAWWSFGMGPRSASTSPTTAGATSSGSPPPTRARPRARPLPRVFAKASPVCVRLHVVKRARGASFGLPSPSRAVLGPRDLGPLRVCVRAQRADTLLRAAPWPLVLPATGIAGLVLLYRLGRRSSFLVIPEVWTARRTRDSAFSVAAPRARVYARACAAVQGGDAPRVDWGADVCG